VITKPTVFVLGAGASQPYGFPLGVQLVDQICAEISGVDPLLIGRLERLGHDRGHTHRFVNAMMAARPYSIDAFLETRREFREVGKAAIADVLLRAEANAKGQQPMPGVDWYRYVLNKFLLLQNPKYFEVQAKRLTIVTFNFDRSFEYALFRGVRHGFEVDDESARNLVTEVRIHHVHGVLGEPLWLYPDSENGTDYGAIDDALLGAVPKAVENIKIVDEEIAQAVIEDVEAALRKAVHVYFIGFGFDIRNLTKLRTPDSVSKALVLGTAFEWTNSERLPVLRHFNSLGHAITLSNVNAIDFVREHAAALFG